MKKLKIKTGKGSDYIGLALYAFAGLGIEAVYVSLLEPLIYGAYEKDWTAAQNISHWIITCITWGIIAYFLIKSAKGNYGFDLLEKKPGIKVWQWICIGLCIILSFWISYREYGGFKPFVEYQRLGTLKFIFQYIYYIFEALLFTLIIIFGQKACEMWFKKVNIPYGGFIAGATWGLAHIFTKGSVITGVFVAFTGFLYGAVYLLLNRNFKKTLPVLAVMFIL